MDVKSKLLAGSMLDTGFEWAGIAAGIDPGLVPQHKVQLSPNVAFAFPLAGSMTTPPIFPTGSTQPATAYSGTFIPEIWSGKLV
jgi:hypothetical protein